MGVSGVSVMGKYSKVPDLKQGGVVHGALQYFYLGNMARFIPGYNSAAPLQYHGIYRTICPNMCQGPKEAVQCSTANAVQNSIMQRGLESVCEGVGLDHDGHCNVTVDFRRMMQYYNYQ